MPEKLRVLLIDDHELFRAGFAMLLATHPDIQVVGQAENGETGIQAARATRPDVALVDVHMPVCDGIQAVKAIKREMPQVKIVMLSASDDDEDLFAAIKNGADGYLLKNQKPSQLFDMLEGIRRGEAAISGILADRILNEFRRMDAQPDPPDLEREGLTARETRILELVVQGDGNKEIADALYVSENTVKLHLHNIMQKLHLQNRIQLAVYVVREGLLDK